MKNSFKMLLRILFNAIILSSCLSQEKVSCPDFSKDKSMSYRTANKYSGRHKKKISISNTIAWFRYRNNIMTPENIDFPNIHELTNDPVPLTQMSKVSSSLSMEPDNTININKNGLSPRIFFPVDTDFLKPSNTVENINSKKVPELLKHKESKLKQTENALQDSIKAGIKNSQPEIDN